MLFSALEGIFEITSVFESIDVGGVEWLILVAFGKKMVDFLLILIIPPVQHVGSSGSKTEINVSIIARSFVDIIPAFSRDEGGVVVHELTSLAAAKITTFCHIAKTRGVNAFGPNHGANLIFVVAELFNVVVEWAFELLDDTSGFFLFCESRVGCGRWCGWKWWSRWYWRKDGFFWWNNGR